jgi:hypothetical protein
MKDLIYYKKWNTFAVINELLILGILLLLWQLCIVKDF